MSLILNEKYIKQNNSYTLFITNRFLRIYPIYWFVLIAILLFVGLVSFWGGFDQFKLGRLSTIAELIPDIGNYELMRNNFFSYIYMVLTNILIFGQDVVMFLWINPENGNFFFTSTFRETQPRLHQLLLVPQAWTLGNELTFYLLAPFLLRKGIKFVTSIIIFSLAIRFYIYSYLGLNNDPWTYRFFPTEIMFFLLGYVSYKINLILQQKMISKWFSFSTLLFNIVFTVLYIYLPSGKISFLPFSFKELAYFIMIIFSIPVLFNFLKKNSFDRQIGELSYPIYISHILVAIACAISPFEILKTGSVVAVITIILSYLLNAFIATPIEKYRQSRVVS